MSHIAIFRDSYHCIIRHYVATAYGIHNPDFTLASYVPYLTSYVPYAYSIKYAYGSYGIAIHDQNNMDPKHIDRASFKCILIRKINTGVNSR